jgi:hypothetical protein
MTQYVAYNKMYYKGKPFGRPVRTAFGKTKTAVTAQVTRENAAWNRFQVRKKTAYRTKLVAVKRNKYNARARA